MLLLFSFISIVLSQNLKLESAGSIRKVQKKYTLVAKNVRSVRVHGSILYVSQKKNQFMQVDLMKKLGQKKSNIYYRNHLISKCTKALFPIGNRTIFIQNKRNEILLTGEYYSKCGTIFGHKNAEDCERDRARTVNKVILKNIKKCWSDAGTFAYVKNNNLIVTGQSVTSVDDECYEMDTKHTFFKGKGEQVKQVVSGRMNVFVLMKDGSVWARGNNEKKLISDSDEKYHKKFVRIVPGGVKSIAATYNNVGMLKKDGTLWLWGERTEKNKVTFSAEPYQIARNVKEFSLGMNNFKTKTGNVIVLLLKKNNKAYGWGANNEYALTSKYKKGWIDKPVKLKSNIKHVYVGYGTTFLLDRKNRLYWGGEQWYTGLMNWVKP